MLCTAYRLRIASTLKIPGALPADDGLADVVVREGPVGTEGKVTGPYRLRDDGRLTFEAPNVARYLCDEESVTIERIGNAGDGPVAGFLIATALPAMLWMRGEIVLHAAAAVMPGASGAFAVMGRSGSGKSTVLREMVAMGARIVADDTIRMRRIDGAVEASGLAGGYFLGEPPRDFHTVDGGLVSARLAGLALLDMPRAEGAPEIRRLSRLEGLAALIGNRHRPRVPLILGLQKQLMLPIAELAARLPVHLWKRSEGATVLEPEEVALLSGAA